MPVTGPIPLPKTPGEAFASGQNDMSQMLARMMQSKYQQGLLANAQADQQRSAQMQPYDIALRQAQAQKESQQAEAILTQQNLLKQVMNGGLSNSSPANKNVISNEPSSVSSGQPSNILSNKSQETMQEMPGSSTIQSNQNKYGQHVAAAKLMGLGEIPIKEVDGVQMAFTPFGLPIPLASGPSKFQQAINAEDAKLIGEWGKKLTSAHDKQTYLDHQKELIKSPVMESIKQNPQLMGLDVSAIKAGLAGTPEQQKLIGDLIVSNKDMYSSLAQNFKGAFRAGEQQLFTQMLINEKDPLPVMIGKMEAMQEFNQMMIKRYTLADDLARNHNMTPSKALETSDKAINVKEIRKKIQDNIEGVSNLRPVVGKTWVRAPSGKIHLIPNNLVPEAISPKNKGVVIKLGANNV